MRSLTDAVLWWPGCGGIGAALEILRQAMSFDTLAPHYRWIEFLCAGGSLQRCRTSFLDKIPAPENILILGEGNGRFLVECCRRFPQANVLCLDASAKMLALAQRNLARHGLSGGHVTFHCADALDWSPPSAKFDLIVTHFFLDCFRPDQLEVLAAKIGAAAAETACWLLADFYLPQARIRKIRSRVILWLLYLFFRITARLPARNLTVPDSFLQSQGFRLRERRIIDWGLLHSDLWQRQPVADLKASPRS